MNELGQIQLWLKEKISAAHDKATNLHVDGRELQRHQSDLRCYREVLAYIEKVLAQ